MEESTVAGEFDLSTHNDIEFAEHDGTRLIGDLYLPKGLSRAPLVVAVHGGGWQIGTRKLYTHWGDYLARNGFGVFAVDYRLIKSGVKTYPGAVYDVKAAVQFVRAKARDLAIDPDRIGLMGDSAGAHLAALIALAPEEFSAEYRNDPHSSAGAGIKAVVGVYGVYDMLVQWQHDQTARPRDQISEKFLGASPMVDRRVFFASSPLSYATVDKNSTRFLLVYGSHDDIVDPATQSAVFLTALKQAQFVARALVVPGAGHFWVAIRLSPGASEPMRRPRSCCF
jgi:acetyl esterase/lipase